jgi:hypothetical protein
MGFSLGMETIGLGEDLVVGGPGSKRILFAWLTNYDLWEHLVLRQPKRKPQWLWQLQTPSSEWLFNRSWANETLKRYGKALAS